MIIKKQLFYQKHDQMHLRLQDFKSVSDYNSTIFRITSKFILCGEK